MIRILVASIVFVAGICGPAAAQYSMGRLTGPPPPGGASQPQPARPAAGLTPAEQRGFAEALKRMKPKDRKRLTKAIKRFTPEESRQFIESVKRQLAVKGTSPQTLTRAR
jgi:hypothetical protein